MGSHPVLWLQFRGVESLILKLALTPALIGGSSLAGRRWGAAVSGWLVGIPFTSGPIALFLALDHGASSAASVSVGTLLGTISEAIFCLAYSFSAARGVPWLASLGSGCVGFAASTVVLQLLSVPLLPASLATLLALVAVILLVPRAPDKADEGGSPAASLGHPRKDGGGHRLRRVAYGRGARTRAGCSPPSLCSGRSWPSSRIARRERPRR